MNIYNDIHLLFTATVCCVEKEGMGECVCKFTVFRISVFSVIIYMRLHDLIAVNSSITPFLDACKSRFLTHLKERERRRRRKKEYLVM